MRRWRKNEEEDEVLSFEDLDDDDNDDGRYRAPRRQSSFTPNFNDLDDEELESNADEAIAAFDKLAPLVRAGQYKPKQSDPYTLHLLYQNLRYLGEI